MEDMRMARAGARRSQELSVTRIARDAGRSYLANAGKWIAIALAVALEVGLVFVLLALSGFMAEERGPGDALSFLCTLGALGGVALFIRSLHRITVLSLASESFGGRQVRGIDLAEPIKSFLTSFLGALFVVLAIFVALQFVASAVNSPWVFVVLLLVIPAAFLVVLISTDTKQGVAVSIAAAWRISRKEFAFGVTCVLAAAVLAAIGAWSLLVVDLPSVWTELGAHILVRFGITAAAVLGVFLLVLQPLVVFGAFAYRAVGDTHMQEFRVS